jgi:hypothetical protein
LAHRIAQSWLLRTAVDYLDDPTAQVLNAPLSVLQVSPVPEAAQILLDTFVDADNGSPVECQVSAIAHKVSTDQYGQSDLLAIETTLVTSMRHRARGVEGLDELIIVMPDAAKTRLIQSSRGLRGHDELVSAATNGEWVRPQTAESVVRRLAEQVRDRLPSAALYDTDAMTPRIIREALFSARAEHRHNARLVLLGSPIRAHVAAALVAEIDASTWQDPLVRRMLRLMRSLAGPEQEPRMLGWVPTADDAARTEIALTLGHLPPSPADLSVLVDTLGSGQPNLDQAILYGVGMRRDSSLEHIAGDTTHPSSLRDAAGWWLTHGGAIVD